MDDTERYERESMLRALEGDADAGREVLRSIVSAIDLQRFDSALFPFLVERLLQFLDDGIPLTRALCVEDVSKGGRPKKHDALEIAAADILLRDHAGFAAEKAIKWLITTAGVDRRLVQRIRTAHDKRYNKLGASRLMESLDEDLLLHLSGSLRKNVAEVLPQK